jgi:methylisocitrate lyase
MEKKVKFRDLISKEQVFAPCVYDCMSARAAYLCGYKAMMLSGGAVSYSMDGLPDMAFTTMDEVLWISERIISTSPLPLIVDADDGFGESPAVVYRNMYRFAKAGAMGITVDDSTPIRGFERMFLKNSANPFDTEMAFVPRDVWLAKIKASLAACEGSDCVVIARIGIPLNTKEGFIEAMERALRSRDLGAEMVMLGTRNIEDARRVAKYDAGWKMWPDVMSKNGIPNVELNDIYPLGFNFVTFHVFEKAALFGMMKYGVENFKNQNSVYSETHQPEEFSNYSDYKEWFEMEEEFRRI